MTSLLDQSLLISMITQIITTIVSANGLFLSLPKQHALLTEILKIETIVQVVEFGFYTWMAYSSSNIGKVTKTRYIDWFITTPLMLLTTAAFMDYQLKKTNHITIRDFISNNKTILTQMFLYNGSMLLFGYLGEVSILPKEIATLFGFYFFIKSFTLLKSFVKDSKQNNQLFKFMFIVWSLYGFSSLLPVLPKNISYNVLDVVSKNFYGLYIYYKIAQINHVTLALD